MHDRQAPRAPVLLPDVDDRRRQLGNPASIEVCGQHPPGRADSLAQPAGDRPDAGPYLSAMPARAHADFLEMMDRS
jgi:hypothetical protein